MEEALEQSRSNYVTVEGKVLLLKDTGLENYTVGKYIYINTRFIKFYLKKQKQPVDT